MTQDLFNNFLAIIGAFTGLSGLFISLYVLHKEKVKFSVFHPIYEEKSSLMGFNGTYDGQDNIGCSKYIYSPYLLLVWLQINNKSKVQTTIIEMTLKTSGCTKSILNSRTSTDYSIASKYVLDETDKIDIKSSWHYTNILKLPISVSPFSTTEGYFFFRNINVDKKEPFKATLTIKTPQGASKHKLIINPSYPQLIK